MVDGHYELPIPWKPSISFSNNLPQAMARLMSTIKSVEKRGLREKYNCEMSKVLDKGYAEVIQPGLPADKVWYLPHHPVLNPRKPDKLRIVFDCAAKHAGQSLNDRCYQGPDLNNKLIDVLLRFRQHQYAVMGDIEAMYHQVKIPIYDRDALRFLWYNDAGDLMHCRMTSHLFGGIWCASSSTYALRRLLHDFPDASEDVKDVILNSFYVDDCLFSTSCKSEAIQKIQNTALLLQKGGFRLTKFVANDRNLLKSVSDESLSDDSSKSKDLSTGINSKVLGVKWDIVDDKFYFDVNVKLETNVTKRHILSVTSSIFDPLGFVNPIVVSGRLLFQEAVKQKIGWDDIVSQELIAKWEQWIHALESLSEFRIPRCVKPSGFDDAMIQLHHFCDASLSAYGFCTYVRCINKSGQIIVELLMSKCRVAPLKQWTIPKLELQAAVLAARADNLFRQVLSICTIDSMFWSDNETVLKYICNDSLRFNVFVGNRISEIRQLTHPSQWRHIAGKDNPADLVTRGEDLEKMDMNKWLHGPAFLCMYSSQWPCNKFDLQPLPDDPNVKDPVKKVISHTAEVLEHPVDKLSNHYSNWYRLKRATAWWLRLKSRLKSRHWKEEQMSVQEIKAAEKVILKHVQQSAFEDELRRLTKGETMRKSSSIYDLNPFVDDEGLIRVGGRIRHAAADESKRHPIIIPRKHPVSTLVIREVHEKAHVGVEWTLGLLRDHFWIPRARQVIKSIVKNCIRCKKMNAPLQQQQMSDLPAERLEAGKPPFTYVGIDIFGPFMTKLNRSQVKRWGCLFTCLTTRSVHIEVLHGMDTEEFLNAFRRFSCRRGTPLKAYSDNGTNIVGTRSELSRASLEVDRDKVKAATLPDGVEWVFHPPHASHMGGVWERIIRTIRKVLYALLQDEPRRLTDQVLTTLFCEVENIVNSRPITKVSGEASDLAPLTPNHLLLLREGPIPPPGIFSETDMYRRKWKYVQFLADQFWKRWLKEYLPELQRRQKWVKKSRNIQENDLVLLSEENTPRCLWPLGLVNEVICSKDGLVRSVKVRTRSTTLVRPITKIVLLEGNS